MKNRNRDGLLHDVGERGFLSRFLPSLSRLSPPRFRVPPGDDAAVLRSRSNAVLSIDGLTEGTHFKSSWGERCARALGVPLGRALGWKLLGSALSDLAAMGGSRERWAMIYLGAPGSTRLPFLHQFYLGLKDTAGRYQCALAGGDTVRAKELTLVAAVGGILGGQRPLLRTQARPGDFLCVAGDVGDAPVGLKLLEGKRRLNSADSAYFIRRFFDVRPRFQEAETLSKDKGVTSLLDLSDSLGESVQVLSRASRVGVELEIETIPVSARYKKLFQKSPALLSGGEDYSLLFTVRPSSVKKLKSKFPFAVIGRVLPQGQGLRLRWKGKPCPPPKLFHHYKEA